MHKDHKTVSCSKSPNSNPLQKQTCTLLSIEILFHSSLTSWLFAAIVANAFPWFAGK
jgi:hypothetical protein